MKKILTFITTAGLTASMLPFSASAEEYEKYPSLADFSSYAEFGKELSDGIRDGRYFYDFDGNGRFDWIDANVIARYLAEEMTGTTDHNWEGKNGLFSINKYYKDRYSFLKNYDIVERDEMLDIYYPLNNDILENVIKYGDISGDGLIDTEDASILMCAYSYNFELGDVNWDGSIDASDASYVLEFYSRSFTNIEVAKASLQDMVSVADMNGDSIVDAIDASLILKAYSESSTSD